MRNTQSSSIKVLVVGSGGREHAIAWKLKQSKKVSQIFCAPGNGGMTQVGKCVNVKDDNIRGLADFAQRNKIGLTIVGPEKPLVMGIVDEFRRRKLKVFGPEKKAAQLEASKVFAKEFMKKYHIPTAPFRSFDLLAEAIGFCKSLEFPAVIKADGLAAGKGVIIVHNMAEATQTLEEMMVAKRFGKAGQKVVIESCLVGQEVSVMALTDGLTILPLLPSQDHKQAYEGDKGPNTGGMGAYCPTPFVSDEIKEEIFDHILAPTMSGLRSEKISYSGVLYAGIMLTANGPKVLEYNCRFGDPETQVVLPLLKTDFVDLLQKVVNRRLASVKQIDWKDGSAACVVMASKGYPGRYRTGFNISGLKEKSNNSTLILHAGTRREGNQWKTAGGRVLNVVGIDHSLPKALEQAYGAVRKIRYDGIMYRKDIGFRVLDKGSK